MAFSGGEALARQLRAEGVEVIFGLPGDQLMVALDALVDVPEIRYLVTRHEQATTYMADGYARAAGRPGVACVVPGVGVYNAASGLATAYACSSPVLLLASWIEAKRTAADRVAARPARPPSVRPSPSRPGVLDPAEIPAAVREAFHVMTRSPAPGGFEIPPETFAVTAATSAAADRPTRPLSISKRSSARRGVGGIGLTVIGRRGVVLGDASDVDRGMVAGTGDHHAQGRGDRRSSPAVGRHDVGELTLRPAIDAADVVLAGTRSRDWVAAGSSRSRSTSTRPDRAQPSPSRGRGDARCTVAPPACSRRAAPKRSGPARPPTPPEGRPAWRWSKRCGRGSDDGIRVRHHQCGSCATRTARRNCGRICRRRTWNAGFGFPLHSAQGGALDCAVVTVVGDGGFLAPNELATAMQHRIHTVTVVFDDGAYGNSNRDQREKFGGRELGTALENPDWVMLAHAFGAEGSVVDEYRLLVEHHDQRERRQGAGIARSIRDQCSRSLDRGRGRPAASGCSADQTLFHQRR
jgi:acetolactate synthase-1/2/3 large subunit